MQRREFLTAGLVSGAAFALIPAHAFAGLPGPLTSPLAGSVFYTAQAPGRWAGKEAGHVPSIEIIGSKVQVMTGHGMDGYDHYIVKHVLLDENLGFVQETMFNPATDSPISEYDLSGLENRIYALSLCNQHDAWLNVLDL